MIIAKRHKKTALKGLLLSKNGRDDRIRTCDLIVPNDALYQAEPHPDNISYYTMRLQKMQ